MATIESPLENVVRSRRSIRRFTNQAVSLELVTEVLDAARWAPSPHNVQPWRFAVISNAESKEKLALAMGNQFSHDLSRDGVGQAEAEKRVRASFLRITGAPVVLMVCLVERGLRSYPDVRQAYERWMAVQSIGAAIQNLLLSCHDRGLGACWLGAPLFCQETVRESLTLDLTWQPQAMILIGYPETKAKTPPRMELEELVVYR